MYIRRDNRKSIAAAFIGFLFFATFVGPATAQEFDTSKSFWSPPSNTQTCGGSFWGIPPFKLTKTLVRGKYPHDDGRNFAYYFGTGISRTMAGIEVMKFKQYILGVAKSKAYTRIEYATENSPIYIQSNIMRLIAVYVTYMESKGLFTPQERETLIAWGTPMIANQMQRHWNRSPDSRAASGVALMSWGSLTGNARMIKAGYDNYREAIPYVIESIGHLKRAPDVPASVSPEDDFNLTLAHVIEGAAILENLGVDAFGAKYKGKTLYDAIDWWTIIITEKLPVHFQGYSRSGHNENLGWIPIYLSKYPNSPSAARLRQVANNVAQGNKPMFEAISLGTATDCLWGYQ